MSVDRLAGKGRSWKSGVINAGDRSCNKDNLCKCLHGCREGGLHHLCGVSAPETMAIASKLVE